MGGVPGGVKGGEARWDMKVFKMAGVSLLHASVSISFEELTSSSSKFSLAIISSIIECL